MGTLLVPETWLLPAYFRAESSVRSDRDFRASHNASSRRHGSIQELNQW